VWSRKWREGWKEDIEEEVVLTAVQEELLRESKEKSQIALAKETKEANEEKEMEVEGQWRRRTRGVGG
jgi:hypothetical protein